nr:MAG TPA: hypothetical protein [Caudoviricetes sp.]DAT18683.1 MAG TPA: hypothetical protein [Caudoviricetes sp.]
MRVPVFEFYMFYTILVSVGSVSRNNLFCILKFSKASVCENRRFIFD